ncbi:MAG: hypothetical protein HY791_40395 [Deltaproteobacteria bacterium]|nr:hypothetical protein [Deltaproteobacteria bacterium]
MTSGVARYARYPVIYMTFKDVKYRTWPECLEATQSVVSDAYERHREILSHLNRAQIRLAMSPNASHTIVGMFTRTCHF